MKYEQDHLYTGGCNAPRGKYYCECCDGFFEIKTPTGELPKACPNCGYNTWARLARLPKKPKAK